jgi:hypothetical protein
MNLAPVAGLIFMGRNLAPGSGSPPRGNLSDVEGSRIEVITRG